MYTYLLYEAERDRTRQEQRELDTRNGEISLALRRPFRKLRERRYTAQPVTRQPRAGRRPTLRVGAFRSEAATVPEARCN
jgi:hypothetical protein